MQFRKSGDMVRSMRFAVLIVALLAACSDSANTQYLAIGSRCSSDHDCGTSPFDCAMAPTYPGGYCEKACASGQDCPTDSVCSAAGRCRRSCVSDTDPSQGCRVSEGYKCRLDLTPPVCDLP
jgi:hypothetical protein